MKKSRQTKRALIPSVLAVILCVAMLIGTTFAWFTDTASTSVNKIQAGTLDVQLLDTNNQELNSALGWMQTSSDGTKTAVTPLWEPNCTYELQQFQIKNAGKLALKYKVVLNATSITEKDSKTLLDVIEWTVKVGDTEVKTSKQLSNLNGLTIIDDKALKAGEANTISVTAHMKSDAGNDYQSLAIDDFAITVYAKQDTVEYDSSTHTYDSGAEYDKVAYSTVSTSEALAEAITNAKDADGDATNKVVANLTTAGTYTLPSLAGKDVTITGEENTVIDAQGTINNNASSIGFEGVTVKFSNENYKGFQHTGKLTYENCTIEGLQVLYARDVEFVNCTFKQETNDIYNVQVYGSTNVTFTNCHFQGKNKNVYIYQETLNSDKNVTFNNCDFHMSANDDLKSAVMLNSPQNFAGYKYNVVINNCTEVGTNKTSAADEVGSKNYQGLYGFKHDPLLVVGTVTVDNVVKYSNP